MALNRSATKWSRSTGMSIHLQKKSLRCINNYPETVQTGENMGNEGQQLAPFSEMETEAKVI